MPTLRDIGQRISYNAFIISASLILVLAFVLAVGRLFIKWHNFRRLFTDDWIYIASVIFFIASSILNFLTQPYNETQVKVANHLMPPPPNFLYIINMDTTLQDATAVLNNACIFGVKFSFLFFFRQLMGGTFRKLRIYWWCVFIFTIPAACLCMVNNFMVCPAFGEEILIKCVKELGVRGPATLYTLVVVDIVTDLLVISIPIMLLWRVRINLRRKMGFGWLLTLSAFMIVTNIIRGAGAPLKNGAPDIVWIHFWGQMEASLAIMAYAMTGYRALFHTPSSHGSPTRRSAIEEKASGPRLEVPTMPSAEISGLRSFLFADPFEDDDTDESGHTLVASTLSKQSTHKSSNTQNNSVPQEVDHV